jgi:hypothetical protein
MDENMNALLERVSKGDGKTATIYRSLQVLEFFQRHAASLSCDGSKQATRDLIRIMLNL